tara:strand:+ start:1763 stop:1927 length:165 start_codon:yes stop_codon:yes gene_type:complete
MVGFFMRHEPAQAAALGPSARLGPFASTAAEAQLVALVLAYWQPCAQLRFCGSR